MKRTALSIFFLAALVATNCGRKVSPEDPEPQASGSNTPVKVPVNLECPNGTSLSWGNFGRAYTRKYCASCHSASLTGAARLGAPEGVNFDSASDALTQRVVMLRVAAPENGSMPPSVPVSPSERALFREWLNCGAP
ncbi:MAG: hypothetical protein RIQ81_888 [Pseudomonadota bacterium]|jgi:cytochrome c5